MSIHRVTLSGVMMGQTVQNVMHFQNPDGFLNDSQICDEIQANWMPDYRAVLSGSVQFVQIRSQRVDSGITSPFNKAVSIFGAQSGSTLDLTFCCYVLNINTGLVGRHNRGRLFVPGLPANNTNNTLLQSGILGLWTTPLANLTAKYKVGGSRPLTIGVAPRASPSLWVGAIALTLSTKVGIQRRRNIGIGI